MFMEERKYFARFERKKFASFRSANFHLTNMDIRQLILADHHAIEGLFKLYQFYEIHSESVSEFHCFLFQSNFSSFENRLINILERIMSVYYCLFIIFLYKFVNYFSQIRQRLFKYVQYSLMKSIFFCSL